MQQGCLRNPTKRKRSRSDKHIIFDPRDDRISSLKTAFPRTHTRKVEIA
jgi:hypothetical protein